jgi:hypothetical protein
MKRLVVVGLACLLAACQSNPINVLPGPPEKAADFPTKAPELSDCVYRAVQSMRSPYIFHRTARADNLEFLVTARGINTEKQPKLPTLELRFITQGETTTVEMRDTATGDHELTPEIWSSVERCSRQVAKPPAARSTAP